MYPGRNQRLFSNEEEYNHLVSLAEEQWEEKKGDVRYSLKTADDGETRYLEKITLEAIVRNQKARKEYIRNNPESMLESIQEGKDLFLEEEFESILSLIEEREKERKAIRKNPELILEKIEENRKLFLSEEEFNHLVELGKERKKQKEQEKEEIRENPELILWVSEKKRNMFSEEEINRLEVLAKEKIKVRKKKIRKQCGIFIAIIAILIGSFYSYYKVNNRNAFEEMYNSYFNVLPLRTIANMPQIVPLTRDQTEQSIRALNYKTNTDKDKVEISLVNNLDRKSISIISSSYISEEVYLDINYRYEVDNQKLINYVSFRGRNIPSTDDKQKQRKELLEKYNISKEYLQEKSDKLLDTVLTDWKRYSNSSYSKDNMGKLTIEKDEFLS